MSVPSTSRPSAAVSTETIARSVRDHIVLSRARVALQLRDAEAFKRFSALTAESYCMYRYPPLVAKFDTLMRDGIRMLRDAPLDSRRG